MENTIKLAACTIALRHEAADRAFAILADLGFAWADALAYGDDAHISQDHTAKQRTHAVESARARGIAVFSLAGYVGAEFTNPDPEVREEEVNRVKAEIDLAVEVGASIIRVTPGRGEDLDAMRAALIPCLREVTSHAEKRRVKLGMENHASSIVGCPATAAEVCREIGSDHLGIIYEPCNLLGMGEDYKSAFDAQRPHILHVHMKDGRVEEGPDGKTLRGTLLGEGGIDYPGWVSIEYESWHTEYGLPAVREGLGACRDYLNKIADWE